MKLVIAFPLAALLAAPASLVSAQTAAPRVRVVTSIGIFADFIRQVGGDRVEVTTIVPNGGDVHTFEPTPGDIRSILGANLVLLNGRGLDESIAQAARQGSAPIRSLSAGLEPVEDPATVVFGTPAEQEEAHEAGNPHLV